LATGAWVGRQGEKGVKEVVETEVRMVEKGVSTAAAARVEMREGARVAVVREAAVEEWAEVEAEVGLPGVMGVVATWEAMRVVEVMVGAKAVGLAEGTAAVMVAERWVERDRTC
jgi:hypothetical protein